MKSLFYSLFLILPFVSFPQEKDSLRDYSTFINEINSNNLDIDYRDFRISYIYSKEYKNKGGSDYIELKQEVYKYIKKKKYDKVISTCKKILEIDYTSMFAHKYIQQTAKILGDTTLYEKHHHIEFGLLKSIVHNGSGKTCDLGWEVTQIEEEYFILNMIGAVLEKQSLEGLCYKMEVKEDRKKKTYYFDVYYVFQSRK